MTEGWGAASRRRLSHAWTGWAWCWQRWWWYTTAAEIVGFALPALTGLVAWRLGWAPIPFYIAMVVAGAGEGALLGGGQRLALRPVLPVGRRWVTRTSLAAAGAWSIGMLPSTLIDLSVPVWLTVLATVPLAPLVLLSIGIAQWSVLRDLLPDAGLWIPANAVAWLLALPPTFVAPALVPPGAPLAVHVGAWLAAGAIMAAVVAAVTGLALILLLSRRDAAVSRTPL